MMKRFFVKIRTRTQQGLRRLDEEYQLDVFGHSAREEGEGVLEIQGLLSDEQIVRLRGEGYEVEVISDADEMARQRLKELHRQGDE